MQYINHWPDMAELNIPKVVSQDLYGRLLDPTDNITQLKDSDAWNQIEFALTYPEYIVPLSMGYVLSVAIANDSGSGIYLVVPPELSHIISEKQKI